MDLREYLNIIRKRISIILILTIVATATSFVVSFFILQKVYQSSTTLYVGKQIDEQSALAYQDVLMGQTLVKDYREIAKSKTVAQRVKQELLNEKNISPNLKKTLMLSDSSFSDKISVSLKTDTRIILITVSNNDPQVSTIIANKIAAVFREKAIELLKIENVQVLDKADIPTIPVKPNKKMNVAIAFFIGLMAGLGIVFLLEYMDNTVKTPDDITKQIELTVIGAIPRFDLIEGSKN